MRKKITMMMMMKIKMMDQMKKIINKMKIMKYHVLIYHIIQVEEDGKTGVSRKIYDQTLEMDVRSTLGQLREKLAQELGVSVNNSVLRTNYDDKESKNNKFTLDGRKLKFSANSQQNLNVIFILKVVCIKIKQH